MYGFISILIIVADQVRLQSYEMFTQTFCERRCRVKNIVHPACFCFSKENTTNLEVIDDILQFRRDVVGFHNNVRNRAASGQEGNISGASNMMLLNYDVELEFIIRCFGRQDYRFFAGCEFTTYRHHEFKIVQTTSSSNKAFKTASFLNETYSKLIGKYLDDKTISSFPYREVEYEPSENTTEEEVDRIQSSIYLATILWHSFTHMACARIWRPNNNLRYALLCAFRSRGKIKDMFAKAVYTIGENCTSCPKKAPCSSRRYPALCGKRHRIPEELANIPFNTYENPDRRKSTTEKPETTRDEKIMMTQEYGASEKIKQSNKIRVILNIFLLFILNEVFM